MTDKVKVLIIFCASVLSSISNGQNNGFDKKLNSYLSIQSERIGFNGIILVANEKEILFQKAIGFSSLELQVPLTLDSKFKIASISKSFTGMLMAIAIKNGILRLDDKIKPYFTEYDLDGNWEQITIRHLISHTSGIPHWKGYTDYWSIKSRFPLNTDQVLSDIFNMELLFDAGSKVNYSSPAYYILATILERAYDDIYQNILNQNIIDILELKNTGVFSESQIIPNISSGYHLLPTDSLIVAPYRNMSALKGAGNLFSNAYDLLKWNRSMLSNTILDVGLLNTLFEPTTNKTMSHNHHSNYGMGWYIHNNNNNNNNKKRPLAYQVAGGTFGYSSISVIYPKERLTLIILSNISFLPVNEIWNDIEKIILNKPFELPRIIEEKILSKESLQKFTGTYIATNEMKLEILIYEDKLFAKLGNKPPFQIHSENELLFFSKKIGLKFKFNILPDSQTISELIVKGRGQSHDFKKQ